MPTVLIGVGGGIAAYKAVTLVREFRRHGWDTYVLPTAAALKFVGAPTWQELSENPVSADVFSVTGPGHIELARRADLIVVAPATADLIARLRVGMADDLLTATVLASKAPLMLSPAMHTQMWLNPATVDNVAVLRGRGVEVMEPDEGALSSGDQGAGRLPDPEAIFASAEGFWREQAESAGPAPAGFSAPAEQDEKRFSVRLPLDGRTVVITAGGTQEAIDPVRYVGNRSSGHQGISLVLAALAQGAKVRLIAAPMTAAIPVADRLEVTRVTSAAQMAAAVYQHAPEADILIMAAAVADFTPVDVAERKIKKSAETESFTLEMRRTEDILATVSASSSRPPVLIGFGAETGSREEVYALGAEKSLAKGADLLAVNEVGPTTGFGNVPNTLMYFNAAGYAIGGATGTKDEVAADLLKRAIELLPEKD